MSAFYSLLQILKARHFHSLQSASWILFWILLTVQTALLLTTATGLLPRLVAESGIALGGSDTQLGQLLSLGAAAPRASLVAALMSQYTAAWPGVALVMLAMPLILGLAFCTSLARHLRDANEMLFWSTLPVARWRWVLSAWLCQMLSILLALLQALLLGLAAYAVAAACLHFLGGMHALNNPFATWQAQVYEYLPLWALHIALCAPAYALMLFSGIVIRWRPLLITAILLLALPWVLPPPLRQSVSEAIWLGSPIAGLYHVDLQQLQQGLLDMPQMHRPLLISAGLTLVLLMLAAGSWRRRLI